MPRDDRPANPLGAPPDREPVLPAASERPPQPADNGAEAPQPAPQPQIDPLAATVGALVATVDQLTAEMDELGKQNRANSRNLIMLFGAVLYLAYLARKGALNETQIPA